MPKKSDVRVRTKFGEVVKSGKTLRVSSFNNTILKDNEAMLLFMKDGTLKVVAATNWLGGVCDDCTCDFREDEIEHYQVVSFKKE